LSVADQIQYFKEYRPDYTLKNFLWQAIPFSLVAFVSLFAFAYYSPHPVVSKEWIGQFFILISVVTLPHSLLMDTILDNNKKPNNTKEDKAPHYSNTINLFYFLSIKDRENKV